MASTSIREVTSSAALEEKKKLRVAIVFYVWGQLEKRNQDVVVELDLGEGTEIVAGAGE